MNPSVSALSSTRRRPVRRLLGAVAGLAAVVALAGCGGDEESASTASAAAPVDAVFPATVPHEYGETVVPKAPERIAVVGYTEQDTVLALGYKPAAVTEWYGDQPYATWPWAQEALGDAKPEVLDATDGIQYEKLAAVRPDLIIGINGGLKKADYEKLSKVAPTIVGIKGTTDYFSPWTDQTLQIARALGKEQAGQALIDGVKKKFEAVAAAHPEFAGKTATFSQNAFYDGKLYVYPAGLSTEFLSMMGFTINPKIKSAAVGQQAELSAESLGAIESDVLVVAAEKPEDVAALEKVKTYARLKVVSENRTAYTDAILSGAIYFDSPLSLPYVADKLVPQLADAVAGKAPNAVVETADATTPEG